MLLEPDPVDLLHGLAVLDHAEQELRRSHSSEVATTDATAPAVIASRSFERARQINWAAAFSEIPIVAPISS